MFIHNISLKHNRETKHPIYFKHHFCVALSANFIIHLEHNYGLLDLLMID